MVVELPELLCRVNFPLYQACMVSPRHLLLAGGGGAAKTGVFNGFVSSCHLSEVANAPVIAFFNPPSTESSLRIRILPSAFLF